MTRKRVFFLSFVLIITILVIVYTRWNYHNNLNKSLLDLTSSYFNVRIDAVEKLGRLADRQAVEPLIKVLMTDKIMDVRLAAACALEKIKDPRAVDPLITVMNDDKEELVRSKSATILGNMGDVRVVEPLIQTLKNRDYNNYLVRASAAEALGHTKDDRAVGPLMGVMQDECCGFLAAVSLSQIKGQGYLLSILEEDPRKYDPLICKLLAKVLCLHTSTDYFNERIPRLFMSAIEKQRLEVVAGAYSFFILKGENGSEPVLIAALEKYGDKNMAIDFVNAGNETLSKAGIAWLKKNRYELIPHVSFGEEPRGPKWNGQ